MLKGRVQVDGRLIFSYALDRECSILDAGHSARLIRRANTAGLQHSVPFILVVIIIAPHCGQRCTIYKQATRIFSAVRSASCIERST
jgi:hypothetical protein